MAPFFFCVMIVNVTVSLSFNLFKVSLNEYEFVRMFLKVKTKIYCCKKFILVFWIRGAAFVHTCVAVAMFFSWIWQVPSQKQLVELLLWWRTFHWPPKFKKKFDYLHLFPCQLLFTSSKFTVLWSEWMFQTLYP